MRTIGYIVSTACLLAAGGLAYLPAPQPQRPPADFRDAPISMSALERSAEEADPLYAPQFSAPQPVPTDMPAREMTSPDLAADDSYALDGTFPRAVAVLRKLPHDTPEEAVAGVFKIMVRAVEFRPDFPAARGPHEWNGRFAFTKGSVNGCVESAKVFFELFRAAYPAFKAVYLDSFNSASPNGGHAVVEVTGSDGNAFIVDAMAFPRLGLDDRAIAEKNGDILQFPDRGDVFIKKGPGERYRMSIYPYRQVFNGKLLLDRTFGTKEEVKRALGKYTPWPEFGFGDVAGRGLILSYADASRSGFLYSNPAGGKSLYVIYGCYSRLPDTDNAEQREPKARKDYFDHGKTGTCVRANPR